MSALRQSVIAVALVFGLGAYAFGQSSSPGPRFSPQEVEYPGNTRPLAEPGVFDYDAQMFSPVEFSNFEDREPNVGFFLTMDRIYNSISRGGARPVQSVNVSPSNVPTGSDWQWGNRFEAGWMTDAGSGWQAVYEYSTGSFFAAGSDVLVANPMVVTTKFNNFELNRVFRQPLSNGAYFDPYVGFRFLGLSDKTIEDTTPTINLIVSGNRFKQTATNSAFGGHVGGRYNVNRGRFRYSVDGALAATYNRQTYHAIDLLFQGARVTSNEFNDSDSAFVPILDGRMEVAYALTRDIGLRGGFQVLYLWDGVARSDNTSTFINPNSALAIGGGQTGVFDESATIAGFSFGVEWKR